MADINTMDRTEAYNSVDGFMFQDPAVIPQAKKEAEGVKYLQSRLDMNNPDYVLTVYNHAIDKKLFVTPVGLSFLKDLRDYLKTTNRIPADLIHDIEVPAVRAPRSRREKTEQPSAKTEAELKKTKGRFSAALFFAIAFFAALIGMFVIAWMSRNNVTILNYENAIINKYEDWEQELAERERIVREKEMQLGIGVEE